MKYNSNSMYTYIIYIITYQSDKSYGSHRPLYVSFHMFLATMNRGLAGPAQGLDPAQDSSDQRKNEV